MTKYIRFMTLATSATIALATLSACAGGAADESARYTADMPMADGTTMTIGVAVDGTKVVAYACDGSDDEAWFFGTQSGGRVDITGKFDDTLTASVAGDDLTGNLTMDGVTYAFTAEQADNPAGIYTAALDGVRSSWVLRPDGTATGVQFSGFVRDDDVDPFEVQAQFGARVRAKRLLLQAQQFNLGDQSSTINGKKVTAESVTGNTTFG